MTELPVALRAMPEVSERVRELHAQMTLEEKLAQLVGYWLDQGGNVVAPMQGEMAGGHPSTSLREITKNGLGHFTRVYGTRPLETAGHPYRRDRFSRPRPIDRGGHRAARAAQVEPFQPLGRWY